MLPRPKRTADGAAMGMTVDSPRATRRANVRLAIVLALVAAVFYLGILVLKHP